MLKCVLLDANIIIEAYHLGVWEKLKENLRQGSQNRITQTGLRKK
jgi:hypothetical protein